MNKAIKDISCAMNRMDFKTIILRKLFRLRIIGGKHTAIEHLTKGLPKHTIGEAKVLLKNLSKRALSYLNQLLMVYK